MPYTVSQCCIDDLGLRVEHGREIRPCSTIAQLLWFSIQPIGTAERTYWPKHYIWIEHSAGSVQVVCVSGFVDINTVIPFLAGVDKINSDLLLKDHLSRCWIFPPDFSVNFLTDTSVLPTPDLIAAAIADCLAAVEARFSFSLTMRPAVKRQQISPTTSFNLSLEDHGLRFVPNSVASEQNEDEDEFLLPRGTESLLVTALIFGNALSSNILRALNLVSNEFRTQDYNVASSWKGDVQRNRLQAICLVPWIASAFSLFSGQSVHGYSFAENSATPTPDVIHAVDASYRFEQLIADQHHVHRHTVRSVARIVKIQRFHQRDVSALLWFFDGIDVNLRPRSYTELQAMWPTFAWIFRWHLDAEPELLRRFGKEIFSNGLAGANRLFTRWCPTHNLQQVSRDIEDFLTSCALEAGHVNITGALFGSLFSEMVRTQGFAAVFSASDRWHVRQWSPSFQIDESLEWAPLVDRQITFGTWVVNELSTAPMLIAEGVAMRHCIASYAKKCANGNEFVFSLRSVQGKSRSTLHLVLESQRLRIQEHRGFANSIPSAHAQSVAEKLLEMLNALGAGNPKR